MSNETVLVLAGVGVSPYSARGLTQQLEPIPASSNLQRSINGRVIDLSRPQFQKYHTVITGNDQNPPAVDGVWAGREILVDCIAELSYPVGGSPQRPEVYGSSYVDGDFVIYRPQLTMRVVGFTTTKDEYGATTSWSLEAVED